MKPRPRQKNLHFVTVTSKSCGRKLKGTKIYYEGRKPKGLKTDGAIKFGKHILECLSQRFGRKFRWIITHQTDEITLEHGVYRVRTSEAFLGKMNQEWFDRARDIKNDIVRRYFSITHASFFGVTAPVVYVPGTLAGVLRAEVAGKLSCEDRDAVNRFLPAFIAAESIKSVNLLKAASEIKSLKELAGELSDAINTTHGESWWQTFIRGKILIIQQGYIRAVEKMNIAVGDTKFPDFCLVTHDGYLDILEIKKPDTPLLKYDEGRNNYYASAELSRAVIQVENYIENISKYQDSVRSYMLDTHNVNLKVVRPRGVILAGSTAGFETQKQKDDFRLLSLGLKNVMMVTYDELLTRLNNYIGVLEEASSVSARRKACPRDSKNRNS